MSDCVYDSAAEYRYDGGRARYLVRPRDPATLDLLTEGENAAAEDAAWRDFDGESIYRDYSVALNSEGETNPEKTIITPGRSYLAGVRHSDFLGVPEYAHGDQIGTTRAISDHAGELAAQTVYTAFGERVSAYGTGNEAADRTRYGYAGSSGYEQGESQPPGTPTNWTDPMQSLGWLHVGHRYYDSACGRFLQRDPIGMAGGSNLYAYCGNRPTGDTDSTGMGTDSAFDISVQMTQNREIGIPYEQTVSDWTNANGWGLVTGVGLLTGIGALGETGAGAWAYARMAAFVGGPTYMSCGTSDPGCARWGPGIVPTGDGTFVRIWRFAAWGPPGWSIHMHIHALNWWQPWNWLMLCD